MSVKVIVPRQRVAPVLHRRPLIVRYRAPLTVECASKARSRRDGWEARKGVKTLTGETVFHEAEEETAPVPRRRPFMALA